MRATLSLKPSPTKDLARYLELFPQERARLADLDALLASVPEDQALSRATPAGHIVTSALVLDEAAACVLVIDHLQHKRWLPPGGHYEGSGTLVASARREAIEETGIQGLEQVKLPDGTSLLDIDVHDIAARPARQEAAHVHFDFLFLFRASSASTLTPQDEEVGGARWVPLDEFASTSERGTRVCRKLAQLFEPEVLPSSLPPKPGAPVESDRLARVETGTDLGSGLDTLDAHGITEADVNELFDEGESFEDDPEEPLDLTVEDLAALSMFRGGPASPQRSR